MGRSATDARTVGLHGPPAPSTKRLSVAQFYDRIGYDPHPGQKAFHSSPARFKVACCGRRWGKSKAGPHDQLPKMFLKRSTLGWIVAPTYDLGEKEFRVFWGVLIDQMKIPVDKAKTYYSVRNKDFRITTAWGASIEVRSAEHPESLVGEGLDWVIMAEAAKLKLSHWEKYIRPALADKRGSAVFVSTPEGYNWFHEVYNRGQNTTEPDWWSIQSPTWENSKMFSGLDDPEIQEIRRNTSDEYFDQEYGAKFTSFAGRIYSEFDEGYHVLENYVFNPRWPNYMGLDFGLRNPFCALQVQVDPEGNVYIWDEYYQRGKTATEHAQFLQEVVRWRVDNIYHDPSGAEPAGSMERVFRAKNATNRWLKKTPFSPAPNDVIPGIERVKEWLRIRELPSGDKKPRLFVSRDCFNTLREFNSYVMVEQGEKVSERRDPKESPRKKDDHAMDAMRYFFTGHFGLESHVGYQS